MNSCAARSGKCLPMWSRLFGRMMFLLAAAPAVATAGEIDAALEAVNATVRLHHDGRSSTAFVVNVPLETQGEVATLLVSAAHAFENIKGERATVVFRAATKTGWERRDTTLQIREADTPRWVRHPSADVAVMPCTLPDGVGCQPFPLAAIATGDDFENRQIHVGRRVRVACFPAQTESNAAGWPVLRTGFVASHPLTPPLGLERFFVDYGHFGGDSGSAVVIDGIDRLLIAGVVVAMQRQTDRITSPFEEKIIHTPLGLAIVIPGPFLRETIEKWRQAVDSRPLDRGLSER